MRRPVPVLAFAAYVGFVLLVVLLPNSDFPTWLVREVSQLGWRTNVPEMFVLRRRVEFGLNTLMVVPIGLLGSLVWPAPSWRDWLAVGFVGAGAVELLQGLLLPDRAATFSDVVANALGAGLGAIVVAVWRRVSAPAPA